jgi:hypothetical protein
MRFMARYHLPDRECLDCQPAGNRFMKHVRTESERKRVERSGGTLEITAYYRCIHCGRVSAELIDPSDPRRA